MKIKQIFTSGQKNPNKWMIILITVNILYYLISFFISALWSGSQIVEFFSPSNMGLLIMGASGREIVFEWHMYYTLMNANFLHANLMHIGFNMVAFFQLFKPVCWSYGTDRALIIYLISGVFAFFCSAVMGVVFTVGASGAIFGLMGALLFYGLKRGDAAGRSILWQVGVWAVIILVIGFVSEGVNNVAHLTGMAAGFALGSGLGFHKREGFLTVVGANALIAIAVLCLLYPFFNIVKTLIGSLL